MTATAAQLATIADLVDTRDKSPLVGEAQEALLDHLDGIALTETAAELLIGALEGCPQLVTATPAAAPAAEPDERAQAIAAKEAELEAARAALVANFNRQVGGSSRTKQHGIRVDAQIRRGAEHSRTVERLERELAALRRPVRPEPKPVTPDALAAAKYVRNRYGWHKVVRVNRTSVTVETGYSWTDRIPVAKILEVRH